MLAMICVWTELTVHCERKNTGMMPPSKTQTLKGDVFSVQRVFIDSEWPPAIVPLCLSFILVSERAGGG